MTTNETIARWAHKVYDGDGFTATEDVYIVKGNEKLLMMDRREGEPPYYYRPDSDITLWHGEDGLLAEIERRGLAIRFIEVLVAPLMVSGEGSQWVYGESWVALTATPSKLAAALVEVIGEK